MAASCSYCGASLNFGLKFCVVCGRQTIAALNKMGGIKSGVRHGDMTRRMSDTKDAQFYRGRKRSLRFRKSIRTLSQTIFYGFVAGALFFCAVRVTLQALFPGRVNRLVAPIFEPYTPHQTEESKEGQTAISMRLLPFTGESNYSHLDQEFELSDIP